MNISSFHFSLGFSCLCLNWTLLLHLLLLTFLLDFFSFFILTIYLLDLWFDLLYLDIIVEISFRKDIAKYFFLFLRVLLNGYCYIIELFFGLCIVGIVFEQSFKIILNIYNGTFALSNSWALENATPLL